MPTDLTTKEVAATFGVHPATVARWAKAGLIEFWTTPGGRRRYPVDSVRRYQRTVNQGEGDP